MEIIKNIHLIKLSSLNTYLIVRKDHLIIVDPALMRDYILFYTI